jgi:hypothetical protein
MRDHRPIWTICVVLVMPLATAGMAAGPNEPTTVKPLSAEEKQLLAGLLKQFLVDSQGAQRVRVHRTMRTAWGTTEEADQEGWLVAGRGGQPDRVYFMDADSIPAPKNLTKIDFVAACRARWVPKKGLKAEEKEDEFAQMRRDSDDAFAQMQ